MPKPWKTRDARIDAILGLTAHQMHDINIYGTCKPSEPASQPSWPYKRYRAQIHDAMSIFDSQTVLEQPRNPFEQSRASCKARETYIKQARPKRMDPKLDATSSTLTPN